MNVLTQLDVYGTTPNNAAINLHDLSHKTWKLYSCDCDSFHISEDAGTTDALTIKTGSPDDCLIISPAGVTINEGLHVGGTSDPGDNNLLVDGTLTVGATLFSAAGLSLMDDATAADQRATLGGVVVGPASAYDNAIARYDATTGKLVQNSILSVSDLGVIYNESSGLYMMAPYKQTFVDLSTTPVSFFGGNAMNQVACYNFRLTTVSGSFCTFQLFIGLLAGTAWKAVAIAGANCTLGGTPPTFTISGIGDTKTYTLAFSPDSATVTFNVDSTATGNTILSFVASG